MASNRNRYVYILFTFMAFLCALIWAFTNVGYDGEYQIAMSYRFLQGDKMFLEMWEPHQTSIFLPAALMWIYMQLFHTTTGIVLYLQICGLLIRGGIAFLLYVMLRRDLNKLLSYGIALFYFMVSPKDYALPEFGNMQLWYSTLLFCCLWAYLKKQRLYLLILSALFLCLEVLSYPSCAIVILGCTLILAMHSMHKGRDILMFTGICAGLGIAFTGFFVLTMGKDTFMECIAGMLALEPTHTVSGLSKLYDYGTDFAVILLILGAVGVIGFLITCIWKSKIPAELNIWRWLLCCCAVLLAGFALNILSVENRCAYGLIFLWITGMGFWCRKSLDGREKQLYFCASSIGGLGFLATLIMTDLPFLVSGAYGLLAVAFALIPVNKQLETISCTPIRKGFYGCFLCFMALLAFRCVYIRTPLSGRGQICSILSDMSLVRTGPALGIISNDAGVCIQRDSYPEWKALISPGDKVWIVGGVVDTLGYLYEDIEIAAPSTMSTPFYGEAILEYWRLNPDKYPDVIVAEGYMGNLAYELSSNKWLTAWLEEEYQPEQVVNGKYWIYYFRKIPW